jgi:hypothetical protein
MKKKINLGKVGKGFVPHPKPTPKKTPFLLRYSKGIGKLK